MTRCPTDPRRVRSRAWFALLLVCACSEGTAPSLDAGPSDAGAADVGRDATVGDGAPPTDGGSPLEITEFYADPNPTLPLSTVTAHWSVAGATEVVLYAGGLEVHRTTVDVARGMFEISVEDIDLTLRLEATDGDAVVRREYVVDVENRAEIRSFKVSPSVFSNASAEVSIQWNIVGVEALLEANGVLVPGFPGHRATGEFTVTVATPTVFTLRVLGLGVLAEEVRLASPGRPESEPNDSRPNADAIAGGILGALDSAIDLDWVSLEVSAGGHIRAELTDGLGGCAFDGEIALVDATGRELGSHSRDGDAASPCAVLLPESMPFATELDAGTHFLVVRADADGFGSYGLVAIAEDAECGNDIIEQAAGEQCDDGNAEAGDGCSETCRVEVAGTIEGPDADEHFSGALDRPAKVDFYRVTLTDAAYIRATTGVPTLGRCDGTLGFNDTNLYLANERFGLIENNNDFGGTPCSHIDPSTVGLLEAGTYWVMVTAFGQTQTIGSYQVGIEIFGEACGNGVVEIDEECDDGNTVDGDGCSSMCAIQFVDSIVPPGGRVTVALGGNGDERMIEIVTTVRGQSIRAITSNGMNGCDVDTALALDRSDGTRIGDSRGGQSGGICAVIEPARDRFARDLEVGRWRLVVHNEGTASGSAVVDIGITEPACGNGLLEQSAGEGCDDGNRHAGDGCNVDCEVEGNGTVTGPGGEGIFSGGIAVGEIDRYEVVMTAPGSIFVETGVPTIGQCVGAYADTRAFLRDEDLVEIARNENIAVGANPCSRIDPSTDPAAFVPAGRYFVEVLVVDQRESIANYQVLIRTATTACGNDILEFGEACDDGNEMDGDGCSSGCAFEGVTPEGEPNDDAGSATPSGATIGAGPVALAGSIAPLGDVDFYAFTVPPGRTASLRAVTYTTATHDIATCEGGVDTLMRVYDSNRRELAMNDDIQSNVNACSSVDDTTDGDLAGLAAGTYSIAIQQYNHAKTIRSYLLDVELR